MEEVTLHKEYFTYQTAILDEFPLMKSGLTFQKFISETLDGMIYRIKTHVLSEHLANEYQEVCVQFESPLNWWEHFKRDVLHRKNIKYEIKIVKRRLLFRHVALYPKANILFPDKVGKLVTYKSWVEETDGSVT